MTQLTAVAPLRYPLKTAASPAFTPEGVASAFIKVGHQRNISPIGIQEAICAGLDESGLRVLANPNDPASQALPNDGEGFDHDSDGPLQQRPPWWGTVQCRMDPSCSVGMFYDHLVKLDYTNLSARTPGYWIQQVQGSFDPTGSNYQAQWATAVALYNRLAVGEVGIPQANVDLAISIFKARIGNAYVFGGAFSPSIVSQGTDCSGMCDTILQALTHGAGMQWGRHVSTESWPYDYPDDLAAPIGTVGPYGTICAGDAQPGPGAKQSAIPADAVAVVYIMHGGGGENSHMMIKVNDGHGGSVLMETGGAHDDTGGVGQYASPRGQATSPDNHEWTDVWYLPGPITNGQNGFLMALSDQQQEELYKWTGDIHGGMFNPIGSTSPFRAFDEGDIWAQHQLPINDDGMEHPQYVEWAAERGNTTELARLQYLSSGDPKAHPDRAADIELAKTVLARVQLVLSGATPPNVVRPDVVTPNVVTPPAAATGITIDQLITWGRDAVTVIGTIGTWATAIHGLLGQFLPGSSGVIVPTLLAGATTVSAGHTVHKRKQAERVNRMLITAGRK